MRLFAFLLLAVLLLLRPALALSEPENTQSDLRFLRIATGETGGTYYVVGSEIATAISNPPGGDTCSQGGACGVPGLLAAAVASDGSVENVEALHSGKAGTAFVQSDIAYAAHSGAAGWPKNASVPELRAIAALYPEVVHIVTRADSGITKIEDLAGRHVSISQTGSGTRLDAQLVLEAAGLPDSRLVLSEMTMAEAAKQLEDGSLDAFFVVGGWPMSALSGLAEKVTLRFLPINGALAHRLMASHPFFQTANLPAETYAGQDKPVPTLSVAALWVTTSNQPDQLIYDITRVLWNDYTQGQLRGSHDAADRISRSNALNGISIPLHPGAERYYRGAGLLKNGAQP